MSAKVRALGVPLPAGVTAITGRTSSGKSVLIRAAALDVIKQGGRAVILTAKHSDVPHSLSVLGGDRATILAIPESTESAVASLLSVLAAKARQDPTPILMAIDGIEGLESALDARPVADGNSDLVRRMLKMIADASKVMPQIRFLISAQSPQREPSFGIKPDSYLALNGTPSSVLSVIDDLCDGDEGSESLREMSRYLTSSDVRTAALFVATGEPRRFVVSSAEEATA